MKGILGLIIVTLGIVLAASFGARNGEKHIAYRHALHAAGGDADKVPDSVQLPLPGERMQQWFSVGGAGWAGGILLICIGAFLARRQASEDAAGTGSSAVARVDYPASMAKTMEEVRSIAASIAELPMDAPSGEPRARLDALAMEILNPVVDGRGQLVAKHGLAGFAQYFGPFSAGERNLNRAWSALTDGHSQVARDALVTSLAAFEASLQAYESVDTTA